MRDSLRKGGAAGGLDTQDYYRQLLRTVYRLIFLFVAEDRGLLLQPGAPQDAKDRYTRFYSTARVRKLAGKHRGTKHADLWQSLALVMGKLDGKQGCPELALPPLGSFLWSEAATPHLNACQLSNQHLLETVRLLAYTETKGIRRPVDYRNLGSEEFGSIYESLLEQHPEIHVDAGQFLLKTAAGNERKKTGSYYTPTGLINGLMDSALEPVLAEVLKKPDPEKALLALRVCDPACGSGHFLVAAAHRIAKRIAQLRTGDDEPSPQAQRGALRDVIGHCVYGVDINPLSVELCKFSLWLEALEPSRPLSFLDHHIKCGNSLLGATPALLNKGILDEAFEPITGDDKKFCAELKKKNKQERKDFETGQGLFDLDAGQPWNRMGDLATAMLSLDGMPDDTPEAIEKKQARYESLVKGAGYEYGHLWADAWCAAFIWKKTREKDGGLPYAVTEQHFRKIERSPHSVPPWMKDEVKRLAQQYQFFHWHLAFPEVFRTQADPTKAENQQTGWSGGFDCTLGNPPWERVKLQEEEFFAARAPEIAKAKNAAARKKMIAALPESSPALAVEWASAVRVAESESAFLRLSGRYPLGGVGDVNTYAVFADLFRQSINPDGAAALLLPNGLVTGFTYRAFLRHLLQSRTLAAFYGFENEDKIVIV